MPDVQRQAGQQQEERDVGGKEDELRHRDQARRMRGSTSV
jgi:hypothetical protein